MTAKTIVVRLPEPLYRRLEGAVAVTQHTVDELLAETIAVTLPLRPICRKRWRTNWQK